MTRPEQRWLDTEISDELRRTLESADIDEPDSAQLARMRVRLGAALGPAFVSPPPGPRGFQLLSLGKSIGLASVIAVGFGAAFWAAQKASSLQPSAAAAPVLAAATPHVPAVAPVPPPTAAVEPALTTQPTAAAPPPVEDKPARKERPHAGGLGEELRQLESIRGWLARSPQRALAAADEHERRFPRGALGPERELLRIDALLRLGRYERARQRAERVLAAPEGHPYRAQVSSLLSGYRGASATTTKPQREE